MLEFTIIRNGDEFPDDFSRDDYVDFLYNHLDQFGDTRSAINKSIDYAFSTDDRGGGFLLLARADGKTIGEVVINKTGMAEYIPENLLVYIAVDGSQRGQGYGRAIIEKIQEECNGPIALHVEYENPAKRLYERCGFTSKYAEMRYDPAAATGND